MDTNFLKSIFIIAVIASAIYFLPKYVGVFKQIGVKGASTERANEISSRIGSDIQDQVDATKQQILDMKISDIIDGASKLSKISQDIKNGQKYLKEQVDNVLKSKNYGKH